MYEIRHSLAEDGKDVYLDWLKQVPAFTAKKQLMERINGGELGNFGDHKFCRDGVWEMRLDIGAGYRVYYAQAGSQVVLLLCGGDKRSQDADIVRAVQYWQDWQRRPCNER